MKYSIDPMLLIFSFSTILYILFLRINATVFSSFFGIVSLVLVSGYYLAKIVNARVEIDAIGYAFIFGLAIQILSVGIYTIFSNVFVVDFRVFLFSTSLLSLIIFKFVAHKMGVNFTFESLRNDLSRSLNNPVFYIFIVAFVLRFIFSTTNSSSILPDASLYLDTARSLATKGTLSSNVLFDESFFKLTASGLIEHEFVIPIFAIFFSVSNISLSSALTAVVSVGAFLVYPFFDFSKTLLGKGTAIIAAAIISIAPIFLFFSSILFGPEISSLLFVFTAFYLILKNGLEGRRVSVLIIAGIMLGIAEEIWFPQFYFVVLVLPVLIGLFYFGDWKAKNNLINLILGFTIFFAYVLALKTYSLYFLYLPIVVVEIILFMLSLRYFKQIKFYSSLTLGILLPSFIAVLPHYIFPSQVGATIQNSISSGLIPSIINSFTLFFRGSLIQGIPRYANYIDEYATIIIVILFLLSFIVTKKLLPKAILAILVAVNCLLISMVPPPTFPQYLASQGRFYLMPVAIMIIGASSFLFEITKVPVSSLRKFKKTFGIVIIAFFVSSLLFCFFIPAYQNSVKEISDQNPIGIYGWSDSMLKWIDANTSKQDIFLTARARELSWFTNRQTVSIENSNSNSSAINYDTLASLQNGFSAKYLLVDNYFLWSFPQLRELYDSNTIPLGTLILPKTVLLSSYLGSAINKTLGYKLVFSDNSTKSSVWEFDTSSNANPTFIDLSPMNWTTSRGELSVIHDSIHFSISGNSTYAYTHFSNLINFSRENANVNVFVWNISEINMAKIERIELWDISGNHTGDLLPPTQVGLWSADIKSNSLSDMRIVITGQQDSYINIGQIFIAIYPETG